MNITNYIRDTKAEMRHVTWPSRTQAIGYSALVIGVSIGTAVFLGFFDFLFSRILSFII